MWSVLSKAGTVGQTVLSATERYFEPAADVILRVPSLVLLDYLWRFEVDKTLLWGAAGVDDRFGVFNTIIVIARECRRATEGGAAGVGGRVPNREPVTTWYRLFPHVGRYCNPGWTCFVSPPHYAYNT